MIIHPFGFLAVGGELPFTIPYDVFARGALLARQYWAANGTFGSFQSTYRPEWEHRSGNGVQSNGTTVPIIDESIYYRNLIPGSYYHRWNGGTQTCGEHVQVGIWIYPNTAAGGTNHTFMSRTTGGSNGFGLYWGDGSNPQSWWTERSGTNKYVSYSSASPATSEWHYVAARWNSDGTITVSIDGRQRGKDSHAGGVGQPTTSGTFWCMETDDWEVFWDSAVFSFGHDNNVGEPNRHDLNRPWWFITGGHSGFTLDALSSDPLLYLRLGETSGAFVNWVTPGTYNSSSITGTFTRGAPGLLVGEDDNDGAVSMSGAEARYIQIPILGADWPDSQGIAMAVLAEPDTSAADKWIFAFNNQEPYFALRYLDATSVLRGSLDTNVGEQVFDTPACFDKTSKAHIGVTCAGPGANAVVYYNGVEILNTATSGVAWSLVGAPFPNYIGNERSGGTSTAFRGTLDEFQMWRDEEPTAYDYALMNARARFFDDYAFQQAKWTPAFFMELQEDDVYQTTKVAPAIGPNYGTMTGNTSMARIGPPWLVKREKLASQYDGVSDNITLTNTVDLDSKINGTGNFTVSAWAMFDDFGVSFNTGRTIIRNDNSWMLYQYNNTGVLTGIQLVLIGITTSDASRPQWALSNLVTDKWYHCVATYDSTAGEAKLYVDGILRSTKTSLSGTLANPSGVSTVIGETSTGFYDFDGGIAGITVDPDNTWTLEQVREAFYLGGNWSKADAYALALSPDLYYPLNEPFGMTATDLSTNGYNGVLNGNITQGITGPCINSGETAYNFTDTAGYVNWNGDLGYTGNTTLTIACWVRPQSTAGITRGLIHKDSTIGGSNRVFSLYVNSSNHLVFAIFNNALGIHSYWELTSAVEVYNPIPDHDYWYHVAATWEIVGGTGAAADASLYINGRRYPANEVVHGDFAGTYVGSAFTLADGVTDLRIGTTSFYGSYQAHYAKVFIKDTKLTAAEVWNLYSRALELDYVGPPVKSPTPTMQENIFVEDFEDGTLNQWDYVTSNNTEIQIVSSPAQGSYAVRCSNGSGNTDSDPYSIPESYCQKDIITGGGLISALTFQFYMDTRGSDDVTFLQIRDTAGAVCFSFTPARQQSVDVSRRYLLNTTLYTALNEDEWYTLRVFNFDWANHTIAFELTDGVSAIVDRASDVPFNLPLSHAEGIMIVNQLGDSNGLCIYDNIQVVY